MGGSNEFVECFGGGVAEGALGQLLGIFRSEMSGCFNRSAASQCLLPGIVARSRGSAFPAREPDDMRMGPLTRTWAAGPRHGIAGLRAYCGLALAMAGSRASGTRGQASLCPHRRPPQSQRPVVGVFCRGGPHCGCHATPNRDLAASKRGELHH